MALNTNGWDYTYNVNIEKLNALISNEKNSFSTLIVNTIEIADSTSPATILLTISSLNMTDFKVLNTSLYPILDVSMKLSGKLGIYSFADIELKISININWLNKGKINNSITSSDIVVNSTLLTTNLFGGDNLNDFINIFQNYLNGSIAISLSGSGNYSSISNAGTPATPNWQVVGGSSASSGPTLLVRASANSAITVPFANATASINPSPVIANCFGSVATNVGAAYNAATGVFTAPSAGLYLVSVQVITAAPVTTAVIIPYLDVNNDFINNTSNTNTVLGPDFLGTATVAPSSLPGTQNRGTLTTQVYLTAGQVFSIRFYQSSTAVQPISSTNGTTNFTVVKLL